MSRKMMSRNSSRGTPSRRLSVERLEPRDLLVAVDSIFDGSDFDPGDGSCDIEPDPDAVICTLRAAIEHLNASGASGEITFDIEQPDPPQPPVIPTLHIGRPLPGIRVGVTIDGTSQPGTGRVELSGILTPTVNALILEGGASTVKGMIINGFGGHGIVILFKDNNTITNNYIGTDTTGAERRENGGYGISIQAGSEVENDGANSNVIIDNVISGNRAGGIIIGGVGIDNRTHDRITNNKIGTDISGTIGLGNGGHGITVQSNVLDIGISNNVISDNDGDGIHISDEVREITIRGNRIGTNRDGSEALGNGGDGISVQLSPGFPIGGTSTAQRNIISANGGHGIWLEFSPEIAIEGNHIGVDESGLRDLGNGLNGVYAFQSSRTQIGGTEAGAGNIISGNGLNGVLLDNATAQSRVQGNRIGTTADGASAIPNLLSGVALANFPSANLIGGASEAERNIISGNGLAGVSIQGPFGLGNDPNAIQGNFIGTDASGTLAVANLEGVVIDAVFPQVVGGNWGGNPNAGCVATCNVISGNSAAGVRISNSVDTLVTGNFIGVDVSGKKPLANHRGIVVNSASRDVQIGEPTIGAGNNISGNVEEGLVIANAVNISVLGNYIGTDVTGVVTDPDAVANNGNELGNGSNGIVVRNSQSVQIGGPHALGENCAALCNVIAGNDASGILITDGASDTTVAGNFIGTDRTGAENHGNAEYGVAIIDAPRNKIGGTIPNQGNLILGHELAGVYIRGGAATENIVAGNASVQTAASPTGFIPSLGNGAGVLIEDASNNRIGGAIGTVTDGRCLGACNTISGNIKAGVAVIGNTSAGNRIERNSIFKNGGLAIDLGHNGVTPNDHLRNQPADTDAGPNALLNFPVGITAHVAGAETIVSGVLDTDRPDLVQVDVYANSSPDDTGFGEGRLYLGSACPTCTAMVSETGTFALTLTNPIPVGFPYLSAVAIDNASNTSEYSPVCLDTTGDNNPDSDGDSLCDDWEQKGIDFNGDGDIDLPLNLPRYGADPRHKNLYVEIDYLEAPDHEHRPSNAALQDVGIAFDNAPVDNPDGQRGIFLQFLIGETDRVQESSPLFFGAHRRPGPADDFFDVKRGSNDPANPGDRCGDRAIDGHFGTLEDRRAPNCHHILGARSLVFHYAVYAHEVIDETGVPAGGLGELPGNDLVIEAFSDPENEAAALMHELGHNLGLDHGGGDEINCKPNYLSIMNYSYSYPNVDPTRPLDYSGAELPVLQEDHLDEVSGIGGPAERLVLYGIDGEIPNLIPYADEAIDWNGDGDTVDRDTQADINAIEQFEGCHPDADGDPDEMLHGHDDWANLVFNFRISPDFGDGAAITPPNVHEPTEEEVIAVAESFDFDHDGASNYDDNCPAVANPAQADADGDGIGDSCEPLPPLIGDLNLDGIVDRGDVAILTRRLGRLGALPSHGDLDGDADVDLDDLAILQSHLGETGPVPSPTAGAVTARASVGPPTRLPVSRLRLETGHRHVPPPARRIAMSAARVDAALESGPQRPTNSLAPLRASRQVVRRGVAGFFTNETDRQRRE